jgi:hypothetical protein
MRTGDSVVKVIVCVKQVPDMTEAKMDREAKTIIREGVSSIINPYDIHAVEEGLRIREKKGGSVIALSMGIPSVVEMLKQIIAMGVDEGVLLTDKAFAGSDTLATSYTLSKAIEKINDFDIILCGKQTVDGDTAQVGPGLAEKLGIPHITNVVDIREIEENYIECKRTVENGWEVIKPVILFIFIKLSICPSSGTAPAVIPVRAPCIVTFVLFLFNNNIISTISFSEQGNEIESAFPSLRDSSFKYS